YTQLPGPPGVWVYRVGGVVVVANFADDPACLGELAGPLLLSTSRAAAGPEPAGQASRLGPWGGVIVRGGGAVTWGRGAAGPGGGRDGHRRGGLVGERDRQLPERGRVERRRITEPLDVGLVRAELVPGEVGQRREETEFGGPLGQDRVQRAEPRGEDG